MRFAAVSGTDKTMALLLRAGAWITIDERDKGAFGAKTALIAAAETGKDVILLLQWGASPGEVKGYIGQKLFHYFSRELVQVE